jgi:hypothetical protein
MPDRETATIDLDANFDYNSGELAPQVGRTRLGAASQLAGSIMMLGSQMVGGDYDQSLPERRAETGKRSLLKNFIFRRKIS